MAIKVSKYIVRMMNRKKGIIDSPPSKYSVAPVESIIEEDDEAVSFNDFVEHNDLLYLGHYQKSDLFMYVCSNQIFILKLLDIFEKQYLNKDLKTVRHATDSNYKLLKGLPLNTYKDDFNSVDFKLTNIHELSEFIPKKDSGNYYSLRFQIDDGSDFSAFNNLTAIYYFHGSVQSIHDYLSYFPLEEQLTNLTNTISRFEKDLSIKANSSTYKVSQDIANNFLPVFQAILLEKKLEKEVPINNQKTPSIFKV